MKAIQADLKSHVPLVRNFIKYGATYCADLISDRIGLEVDADLINKFCRKMCISIPDRVTCNTHVRDVLIAALNKETVA